MIIFLIKKKNLNFIPPFPPFYSMISTIYSSLSTFYLKNGFQSLNFLIFAIGYYAFLLVDYAVSTMIAWESNFTAIFTLKVITSKTHFISMIFLGYSCFLALITFFWTALDYTPKQNKENKENKNINFWHIVILVILMIADLCFYEMMKEVNGLFMVYIFWTFLGGIFFSKMLTYKINSRNDLQLIKLAHICLGALLMQGIPVFMIPLKNLIFLI